MGNKATNMSFFQLKPQEKLTLIANVGLVHYGVLKVNLIHQRVFFLDVFIRGPISLGAFGKWP